MSEANMKPAARRVLRWFKSPEGIAARKASDEMIKKIREILAESRNIPIHTLHERFTI